MSEHIEQLAARIEASLSGRVTRRASLSTDCADDVAAADLLAVATLLRDTPSLRFEVLIDAAGVDYHSYGVSEWRTNASASGFGRGVNRGGSDAAHEGPRFAVVYQLLSITHNERLSLRACCPNDEDPQLNSLVEVWASANWFEREAFDLFGITFNGHPDLRRLLTDYGFIGHPFRKDFPLVGNVEVRYDETLKRVVYEPVQIVPRTLVPRVIRDDNRWSPELTGGSGG
ncbi:MAG: NADH-quinone oxidoreductase subunit C [Nevskiaceae bacterium]|jgi:NADH-quinone oxidoreductase subunit C|nr:NADH-quinone oxidoreductase subunit C [Nevskiaceae bacterium]